MKVCKIKLIKKFEKAKGVCANTYPEGYDPQMVNIVAYDENPLSEGDNVGYCIGLVADDFKFTSDMTHIKKAEAQTFIDARAEVYEKQEHKDKFKQRRKGILTREKII